MGHRRAEGMLLYPTVGSELEESMMVQGHRIRVATVDLGLEWEEVAGRLMWLVGGRE